MSHTTVIAPECLLRFVTLTVTNYTVGGEAVSAADANCAAVDGVFFGTIPPSKNSLGVALFPLLNAGKIQLFQFVSGSPVEIPTTNALNAVVPCLVHVSGL